MVRYSLHKQRTHPAIFIHGKVDELLSLQQRVVAEVCYTCGSLAQLRLSFCGEAVITALRVLGGSIPTWITEWKPKRRNEVRRLLDAEFITAASTCQSRMEWRRKFPTHVRYILAHRPELWDRCTEHMTSLGVSTVYLVYAYEFADRQAYVGLTRNPATRHASHIHSGVVRKKPGVAYQLKTLAQQLTQNQARVHENTWINRYRNDGWKMLNKQRAGGLGSAASNRYTRATLLELSAGLTRAQFKAFHWSAYLYCVRYKMLDELAKANQWPKNVGAFKKAA